MAVKNIAIFGAGGGGTSAAAHLTTLGFEIRLYSQDPAALAPLQEIGGIHYTAPFGDGFAPLGLITDDAEAAMDGAELVMIVSPAHLPSCPASSRRPTERAATSGYHQSAWSPPTSYGNNRAALSHRIARRDSSDRSTSRNCFRL